MALRRQISRPPTKNGERVPRLHLVERGRGWGERLGDEAKLAERSEVNPPLEFLVVGDIFVPLETLVER